MTLYDFDGSLYGGALLWDFFCFCFWRRPSLLLRLPRLLASFLRAHFSAGSYEPFWQALYLALSGLRERDVLVQRFWSPKRLARLQAAAFEELSFNDLLLSSAPDFLFQPLDGPFVAAGFSNGRFSSMRPGVERLRHLQETIDWSAVQGYVGTQLADHTLAMELHHRCYRRGERRLPWETFIAQQGRRWGWLQQWLSPEFFRFWCVGWLNLVAAWLLEAFFGLFLPKNLGFSIGYACSLLVSYSLNSLITFRRPMHLFRLGKYVLSYVPNFLVQFLTVFLLHNLLGWPYLLCCFLAAVVGTPVTFLCLKFFAFRPHKHTEE